MLSTPNLRTVNALASQEKTQLQATMGILNCYLREYAIPNDHLEWESKDATVPLTLRHGNRSRLVNLNFPIHKAKMIIPVNYISEIGKISLTDRPWLKKKGETWHKLTAEQTLNWLLSYLSSALSIPFNTELMEQLSNSLQVTEQFVHTEGKNNHHNSFIASEQALLWGHAYHPTPKSRAGVSMDDLLACSPEVGAEFPLYWFNVAKNLIDTLGDTSHGLHPQQAIEKLTPEHPASDEHVLYPCHPWESYTILANPAIKKAIAQGLITPLGTGGKGIHPTSSVRTLYHPDINWFVKFSINVRLTNCVRKNAWYELDSAVQLTNILKPLREMEQLHNPVFKVMAEPFATTINLSRIDGNDESNIIKARESFGILYRENFTLSEVDNLQPSLAGALFSYDKNGRSQIAKQLSSKAISSQCSYAQIANLWFERYIHCLVPGVFNYFFKHGVAFEPHLQNTLIGFDQNMPCCVWVRDLEGTKLLQQHWPDSQLQSLSERAKQSVYYTREQGWNRIGYCTFINNVSEAIFFIANGEKTLEKQLWQHLRQAIHQWQSINGKQPELEALLQGGAMPSKNNFTTRLMKKADKESNYTMIPVPWINAQEGC